MIKYLCIFIILVLMLFHYVSTNPIDTGKFEVCLLYFEKSLNGVLYYCEKIDRILFVPIKKLIFPNYNAPPVSNKPQEESDENKTTEQTENIEATPQKPITRAHLELKTGFIVKGELINSSDGEYTIILDGFPVTFSPDEIKEAKVFSE